jgi:hypothetical protein
MDKEKETQILAFRLPESIYVSLIARKKPGESRSKLLRRVITDFLLRREKNCHNN